jgi:hypothetical protein
VIIALGPWSRLVQHWAPIPEIYGLKGHSNRNRDSSTGTLLGMERRGGSTALPRKCSLARREPPMSAPSTAILRCRSIPPT